MSQPTASLGKYQILEELGHGGFATVYKAHDPDLGLDVALKVLDSTLMRDRAFVERFRTEARVAARLKHPNIARVYNIDQAEGRMFIAFELVPGHDLREMLTEQPLLDWKHIDLIVRQVGEALDYAHAQNVLHRDVKPSNILVADNGSVILTDFGLAKAAEGTHVTTTGLTVGTYAYIAPEQATNKDVDGRADLYSLGVVAYELCTGRVPFASDSAPALIHDQVYTPPPAPSQMNARVATPIEAVLLKALAKDREQRYQSGKELAIELSAAIEKITGQHLADLYQQAITLEKQGDFEAAEANLRQILAIQPDDDAAQALLNGIDQRRALQQRYQQLAVQVKQIQVEATELRQANPNLNDPDRILDLLVPTAIRSATPATAPEKSSLPRSVLGIGAVIIIGAIVLALVWIQNKLAAQAFNTSEIGWRGEVVTFGHTMARENFFFGLSLGLVMATIVLLIVFYFNSKNKV